jgi:hypothetical protein
MSSLLRGHFGARTLPGAIGFTPAAFTNSNGFKQPFPWRFNRQTQAIDLDFVDGFTNTTELDGEGVFFRGQQFGGLHLVQRLGPRFVEWCENELTADVGTVRLHEAPVVVNANTVAAKQEPIEDETEESTSEFNFESAIGTAEGQYCKTLVFMKPMVITFTRGGTRYYRWFTQSFAAT